MDSTKTNRFNEYSCAEMSCAWENSLTALRQELDSHIFSAYIKPLAPQELRPACDEDVMTFVLAAPSRFVCNHVKTNVGDRIKTLVSDEFGSSDVKVEFIVAPPSSSLPVSGTSYVVVKKSPSAELRAPSTPRPSTLSTGLNPRYTFSNFVVGSSNQFCHAAAYRVAEQPGLSYNPLFIYSGVGLGKTHLLHAIGNAVLAHDSSRQVLYISSEAFMNEVIQSIKNAKMDEFKKRYRSIDCLLIDDIQFIAKAERTQEEFFHTFNALYNLKHQIVISSDKIPSAIDGIEERLQTRFSWGLTADMHAPDFETRVAIIKGKAALDAFSIPEDVARFIAENFTSNVRELEGALTRLHAVSALQSVPVDMNLTNSALKHLLQQKTVQLSVDDIKKAVAFHFSLKVSEMVSKRRTKNLSLPRHIAMYLCRKHTTASYPEIGSQFGGRDHSSVIHAANVISTKLQSDERIKEAVVSIEKKLFSN